MEEEADAAAMFADRQLERPPEAEWPEWSGYIRTAFQALSNDRFRGAMGGMAGIYYTAVSTYARDHGIDGADLDRFRLFLAALDDEYLAVEAERAKAEADAKAANKGG